jgi:hypothetical protein
MRSMDPLTLLIATAAQRRSLTGATPPPRRNRPPVRAGRMR